MQNVALLQVLDWLLDGKGSLTLDGRLWRPKKGKSHVQNMGIFFGVSGHMVLSQRAKFQLIINIFRVKANAAGLLYSLESELKQWQIVA